MRHAKQAGPFYHAEINSVSYEIFSTRLKARRDICLCAEILKHMTEHVQPGLPDLKLP